MKSLHLRGIAGNCKLRGKKIKLLTCKCCEVQNFTEEERIKEAKKEIQRFIEGKDEQLN